MQVVLTNAGQALLDANQGPVTVTSFVLGSAYGYIPQATDTAIHGTAVFTGVPTAPIVVNSNVVCYTSYLDYTAGPFTFGEIGLFVGTTLFALAASDTLIQKTPVSSSTEGNSIRIDEYLSIVSTNYAMWLDLTTSSSSFQLAILASVDQLPPPQAATPNAYVISGASPAQSAFQAYTDRNSLWNFDAYAFANQAIIPITGFTTQSVTIALGNYLPTFSPQYFGQVIVEFSSGVNYGICRYVQSVVISGSSATLNFKSIILNPPVVGDSITIFGRQSLSTTIVNLPIATTATLGGVIVGSGLQINTTGVLSISPTGYPVSSVNGLTGAVVLNNTNIQGFATVAYTGNYSDLNGAPGAYTLPVATSSTLGGVRAPVDGNLTIAGSGVIDLGFQPVKSVNGQTPNASGNVTITTSVVGLVNPTQITNGTDFNTLVTAGLYFGLNGDASSFLNAPTTSTGGTLDVEPFTTTATGGDVIQRYTTNAGMYFRRYTQSTNTWTSWFSVSTSNAIPPATTSTIGGVIVGSGLNVTGGGTLSAAVTSVNSQTGTVILNASNVNAVATASVNAQGGVPSLTVNGGTPNPSTDAYTYGRIPFFQNSLGTWWNAGLWDANANHVAQYGAATTTPDTNTALLANGQQTIDISYNGNGVAGLGVPDYQTVSAEGMVYKVTVAGTTSLDGISSWNVGDLALGFGEKWLRVPGNAASVPYDIGGGFTGTSTANEVVLNTITARPITWAANLAGSVGIATVAATATTTFTIMFNSVTQGTVVFAASATTPTFTTTGGLAVSIPSGTLIQVKGPASPDATLANVTFTLFGLATI
jgi:hypothetical protein